MRLVIEHDDKTRVVLGNGEPLKKNEADFIEAILDVLDLPTRAQEIREALVAEAAAQPVLRRARAAGEDFGAVAGSAVARLEAPVRAAIRKVLRDFKARAAAAVP